MLKHAPMLYSTVTGDLPGALAAAAEAASKYTQDAKVEQWNAELAQELLLPLSKEWEGRRVEELPKSSDVVKALARYNRAYKDAESNEKRKMLFNAFYSTFRPEFYDKSLSKVLWEKLEHLDYPDLLFLARVLESTNPEERHVTHFGSLPGGFSLAYRGHEMPIQDSDDEFVWAQRLVEVGLVTCEQKYEGGVSEMGRQMGYYFVAPLGLAARMKEFALREFEKWEPPTPAEPEAARKPGDKKPSKEITRSQLVGMIAAMRAFLIDEAIKNPKADELVDLTDFAVSSEDTVGGELDMSWRTFNPPT